MYTIDEVVRRNARRRLNGLLQKAKTAFLDGLYSHDVAGLPLATAILKADGKTVYTVEELANICVAVVLQLATPRAEEQAIDDFVRVVQEGNQAVKTSATTTLMAGVFQ